MRVFVLTIALLALALPAFACGGANQTASTSSTVATTSAPTTSSAPSGG